MRKSLLTLMTMVPASGVMFARPSYPQGKPMKAGSESYEHVLTEAEDAHENYMRYGGGYFPYMEIVYNECKTTVGMHAVGVNPIAVSRGFFGLADRKISNHGQGIFIMKQHMSEGRVIMKKIAS